MRIPEPTAIPLFTGMEEDDIYRMMECFHACQKTYEKDQVIFQEGDQVNQIGLVLKGTVLTLRDNEDGERCVLETIHFPETFGESFACVGGERLPFSVVAGERCEVLLIDKNRVHEPCSNVCTCHKQIINNLLKVVAIRNLNLNRKIDIMSKKTTKEKILTYLVFESEKKKSRTFTIPIDRQTLAHYLGVERSAMSTEIGKLKKEGRIDVRGKEFTLLF